jgi:hypothetical protein
MLNHSEDLAHVWWKFIMRLLQSRGFSSAPWVTHHQICVHLSIWRRSPQHKANVNANRTSTSPREIQLIRAPHQTMCFWSNLVLFSGRNWITRTRRTTTRGDARSRPETSWWTSIRRIFFYITQGFDIDIYLSHNAYNDCILACSTER